jgi:adenylate kinase family enzyme
MLLLLAGPAGSGKSTAAALLKPRLKAEVYSGKGYLRTAKNMDQAWKKFQGVLSQAVSGQRNVILILVGTSNLKKIQAAGPFCLVRFTAPQKTLEERLSDRLCEDLPPAIVDMLKAQERKWSRVKADLVIDSGEKTPEQAVLEIEQMINKSKG